MKKSKLKQLIKEEIQKILENKYEINNILDKILAQGIESLSSREKLFLDTLGKETSSSNNKIEAYDEGLGIYIPEFEGFNYEGNIEGNQVVFFFNEEYNYDNGEEDERFRPFIQGLIDLNIPFQLHLDKIEVYDNDNDVPLGSIVDQVIVSLKYFDIIEDEDIDNNL
jgi:hypothetical protein